METLRWQCSKLIMRHLMKKLKCIIVYDMFEILLVFALGKILFKTTENVQYCSPRHLKENISTLSGHTLTHNLPTMMR